MKKVIHSLLWAKLFLFLLSGCQHQSGQTASEQGPARQVAREVWEAPAKLDDYWYQGKAEITSYDLSQNRYQDVHPGEVVLIFVTEDFLTDEQVKNERYVNPNSTKVLKTNMMRKFTTGIYEYSIMTSVFTPVEVQEFPHTLKVTNSSQDWCGQSFMQINKESDQYRMQLFSYFEAEGDTMTRTPALPLEDELFNRIRINPGGLPTGAFRMLPSTTYCRLVHRPFVPVEARASLKEYTGDRFEGKQLQVYRVEFPAQQRTLEIVFETAAPHVIAGWTESYPSVFDGEIRTSVAKRKASIMDPYWEHNSVQDRSLRTKLEIEGL